MFFQKIFLALSLLHKRSGKDRFVSRDLTHLGQSIIFPLRFSGSGMVRVISVHHFSRQDVSRCPRPAAVVAAGAHLVIATENQTLEVRSLERPTEQHSFLGHSYNKLSR